MATESGGFRWTEQRRKAVEMVLAGRTDKQIADELGCHKNSVFNWRHKPEFLMEVKRKLDEYATRTRLRRVRETGILTDVLSGKVAKALQEDDVNRVSVYAREYHAFRAEERQDFGDNVQRVEGRFQIDGTQTVNVNQTHSISFKNFLSEHVNEVDVTDAANAETPQDAVRLLAQRALQDTDLLDMIDAEDKKEAAQLANGT